MSESAGLEKRSDEVFGVIGWPRLLVIVLLLVVPMILTGMEFLRMLEEQGRSFWASLNPVASWEFLTQYGGWRYVLFEMFTFVLANVLAIVWYYRRHPGE